VETCGAHIFALGDLGVQTRREETCIACGQYVAVCPLDAIRHKGLNIQDFLPVREDLWYRPNKYIIFSGPAAACGPLSPEKFPAK